MKVRVTLKDPDTMHDAVADAAAKLECPTGITANEWAGIRADRAAEAISIISDQWMPYGEYLVVEFDTEAMTATVRPGSDLK